MDRADLLKTVPDPCFVADRLGCSKAPLKLSQGFRPTALDSKDFGDPDECRELTAWVAVLLKEFKGLFGQLKSRIVLPLIEFQRASLNEQLSFQKQKLPLLLIDVVGWGCHDLSLLQQPRQLSNGLTELPLSVSDSSRAIPRA